MKTPLKKGIGKYSKGKKFTLRSGNTPSGFKMMGASPYKEDAEEGGKGKNFLKKAGSTLVAALTGGLDAVYGSGKIMPGSGGKITFSDDKKEKEEEKDTKSPGEKIIDGDD